MLGFKQFENNDRFIDTFDNIQRIISKDDVDGAVHRSLRLIHNVTKGKKIGLAWSGGKDSVAVDFVLQQYSREFPSCIGMTPELEYPEFMRYVTNNMPRDLKVYMSVHTMQWLSNNLDWLFPANSSIASRWFKNVQHKAQDSFCKDKELDILVTGRRLKDKNYCGNKQTFSYKNKRTGVVRFSPIADWTHEEVLGLIYYYNLPLAPFYRWVNGWVVGSGCWASRQWTGTIQDAWGEVYSIDKTVVHEASNYIQSAKDYVRDLGV